jgi:hypothetical protein
VVADGNRPYGYPDLEGQVRGKLAKQIRKLVRMGAFQAVPMTTPEWGEPRPWMLKNPFMRTYRTMKRIFNRKSKLTAYLRTIGFGY